MTSQAKEVTYCIVKGDGLFWSGKSSYVWFNVWCVREQDAKTWKTRRGAERALARAQRYTALSVEIKETHGAA